MADGLKKSEPQSTNLLSLPRPRLQKVHCLICRKRISSFTIHKSYISLVTIKSKKMVTLSLRTQNLYEPSWNTPWNSKLPHRNPLCPTDPQQSRLPTHHGTVWNTEVPFHSDIANSHPDFYYYKYRKWYILLSSLIALIDFWNRMYISAWVLKHFLFIFFKQYLTVLCSNAFQSLAEVNMRLQWSLLIKSMSSSSNVTVFF